MSIEIRDGHLPPESAQHQIGYPTYERWQSSLPAAVGTVVDAVQDAGITKDTAIVVADGSSRTTHAERAHNLNNYFDAARITPDTSMFILTQAGQKELAAEVDSRISAFPWKTTQSKREIIEAVLAGSSCGDNRQKLAVFAGAQVADTLKSVTLGYIDDDTRVPRTYQRAMGFGNTPNSQVILDHNRNGTTRFDPRPNGSIARDFLKMPGKTIAELKRDFPGFQATQTWEDSMHRQLDEAQKHGRAIFEVNPKGEPLEDAMVWGVSTIKHGKPDYRTIKVAMASLEAEFSDELPIESFPAGPSVPFAIRECTTNVDLAFSAWHVDGDTWKLPSHFIISQEISRQGRHNTVTSRTRADNELFPGLAKVVYDRTGKSLVYTTGVDLQVEHNRESSGYRPNVVEQAATSLVDNLYAQGANELMEFAPDLTAYMDEEAIDAYSIPEERARNVYRQLQDLARISQRKIEQLLQRHTRSAEEEDLLGQNIERYREIYQTVKGKLAVTEYKEQTGRDVVLDDWENVAFKPWKEEIDRIGRLQLHYYNDVLRATPIITREVQGIMREGKYPVAMVVPQGDPTTVYPSRQIQ